MPTEQVKSTPTYTIDVNGALREIERLTKVIELPHSDRVTMIVAAVFEVPISEINGRSLNRRVCLARSMVYLVLRDRYAYTGGQIAKLLNRDTACVCRALQQIDHLIGRDKGVTAMFEDVINRLNNK